MPKKLITIVGIFIKWCFIIWGEHNGNLKRHSHKNNETVGNEELKIQRKNPP